MPTSAAQPVTQQTVKTRKAYIGTDLDREHSAIVWATTRGEARRMAASELDGGLPPGVSLRRWQMQNGWRWECQKCSRACYGQEIDQELDPSITTVISDDDAVFCCIEHLREYEAYWGMHRAIDAAILEDFKKLRPDVDTTFLLPLVGHNEWYGWVNTGTEHVVVWEMVSVHQQRFYVPRHLQYGAEP